MNATLKYLLRKMHLTHIDNRKRYGIFAGAIGICANLLLFAAKFSIGIWSGAVSMIAEAFNNLSDMGTSIVMILGFKIAAQPADERHPFGYGRAEYLAGVLVATAIIFVGMDLLISSVKTCIEPNDIVVNEITFIVLILSIAVKISLTIFYRRIGKKISSATMIATATDSLMDCISTSVVILTMIVYWIFEINADGFAGILVSIIILYGGYKSLKETIYPLLGNTPSPELVDKIKNMILKTPQIMGVHDLIIHDYGPNHGFASVHVEMPSTLDLLTSHETINKLEHRLNTEFNLNVIVHIDPIDMNNPENAQLVAVANKILTAIDARLTLHDFRVVPYKAGRKLLFDIAVPQNFPLTDRAIRRRFQILLSDFNPKDRAVIHFDHQYC